LFDARHLDVMVASILCPEVCKDGAVERAVGGRVGGRIGATDDQDVDVHAVAGR
jgi:hypothetical protein